MSCALYGPVLSESLLLHVEVVTQVLESAAGEMQSAEENHCQRRGVGRGGAVCVGRDILNRMLTWSVLSGENETLIHRNTIRL